MAGGVGVVVVHGIGEQGRFQHLDTHLRGIITALRRRPATRVTVDIVSTAEAAFQANQASWRGGPGGAIQLIVEENHVVVATIHVHEVWWSDVNEAYSLGKQIRFWFWGLSVWTLRGRTKTRKPSEAIMFAPRPNKSNYNYSITRVLLFLIAGFFVVSSLSLGLVSVILKRLLNIEPFDALKVFANYLSSVKLYNQAHRGGSWSPSGADFLDTIDDPPRTSIRRRMLRTLADVALQNYDRWYILAHSQGSVVAFNGLMEPAAGWLGYLDQQRWKDLGRNGMAGPARAPLPSQDGAVPARPVWAPADGIVYRTKLFAKFHGLLTYGNPLEKFAAIWPGCVAVCREPAFQPGTRWLNIFDPVDPVSGIMQSWPTKDPEQCPPAENLGYAASAVLLAGHLKYLDCSDARGTLADGIAHWLVTDDAGGIAPTAGPRFFEVASGRRLRRICLMWLWWILTFSGFALFAGWAEPMILGRLTPQPVVDLLKNYAPTVLLWFAGSCAPDASWICAISWRVTQIGLLAFAAVVAAGIIRVIANGRNPDKEVLPDVAFSGVASPDP